MGGNMPQVKIFKSIYEAYGQGYGLAGWFFAVLQPGYDLRIEAFPGRGGVRGLFIVRLDANGRGVETVLQSEFAHVQDISPLQSPPTHPGGALPFFPLEAVRPFVIPGSLLAAKMMHLAPEAGRLSLHRRPATGLEG